MKQVFLLSLFFSMMVIQGNSFAQKAEDQRNDRALDWFKSQQASDGSFTAKVITSSPAYNCQMILLYEYLGKREEKKNLIQNLVPGILSFQNSEGGFASYPQGPHDQSVSLTCYMALKVAGLTNDKLSSLVKSIESNGGVESVGLTGLPYVMLFGLDGRVNCLPALNGSSYIIHQKERIPWMRVVAAPFFYLFQNGFIHKLDLELKQRSGCKAKSRKKIKGESDFLEWANANLGPDKTLFDYTPTTIPTLMALSKTSAPQSLIEESLASLEKFYYQDKADHLMASPGEASVSETGILARSFLELGLSPESEMLQKSLNFILSTQNRANGSFGFSKSNRYFPDPNDTATTLQFLFGIDQKNGGNDFSDSIRLGLKWILSRQNKDGGFGAWDKNSELNHLWNPVYKLMQKGGVVVGDSIGDDTGRIILALHEMRKFSPKAIDKSVNKAVKWLLKEQEKDGSFYGRWFINYGFGTATSIAALGVRADQKTVLKSIQHGIHFLKSIQHEDGGFSESPRTYYEGKYIRLEKSSPAQTGFIVYHLIKLVKQVPALKDELEPLIKKSYQFLKLTQKEDGRWHDSTWTAVSMGNIEFLIYQYLQEFLPLMTVIETEKIYKEVK